MSRTPLDEALDALGGAGTATVDGDGTTTDIDVTDVDRLGVKVREIRVHRQQPCDIVQESHRLPKHLRALPERVEPIEVDASLGGARLRSVPHGEDREMYEVDVQADSTTIRRTVRDEDGGRSPQDFTLTREQLERLVGQASS